MVVVVVDELVVVVVVFSIPQLKYTEETAPLTRAGLSEETSPALRLPSG